jgi:hypothetical protein
MTPHRYRPGIASAKCQHRLDGWTSCLLEEDAPAHQAVRCEQPYCADRATHLASRIDARRDWFYGCEAHARAWTATRAAECSALPPMRHDAPGRPQVTLPLVLGMWPPKHRQTTRQDAERLLEALEA